jgi:hypothetical protein
MEVVLYFVSRMVIEFECSGILDYHTQSSIGCFILYRWLTKKSVACCAKKADTFENTPERVCLVKALLATFFPAHELKNFESRDIIIPSLTQATDCHVSR